MYDKEFTSLPIHKLQNTWKRQKVISAESPSGYRRKRMGYRMKNKADKRTCLCLNILTGDSSTAGRNHQHRTVDRFVIQINAVRKQEIDYGK